MRTVDSENNKWTLRYIRDDSGVVLHPSLLVQTNNIPGVLHKANEVGKQSVCVHLGIYRLIIRTDVIAFYAFDDNGKLVDIFVLKVYDVI